MGNGHPPRLSKGLKISKKLVKMAKMGGKTAENVENADFDQITAKTLILRLF